MAHLVKQGYLDAFVKPISDGGWGLCEYIVSVMTENRKYTDQEIFDIIAADTNLSTDVKALSFQEIEQIMNWMVGKTFSSITVLAKDTITYVQSV